MRFSKKLLWLIIPLCAVIIFVGLKFTHIASSEPPPPPPNFEDPKGSYSITKEGNTYWVNYSLSGEDYIYPVGKSPIELESYVGKKVIITGTFPKQLSMSTVDQCIVDQCHTIKTTWWGEPLLYAGIDIQTIESH